MENSKNTIQKKWLSTKDICDYLEVSEKTLQRWRNSNFLKLGIHYRRKFPTTQRYIIYNPVLIEKLLTTAGSLEIGK
tara:strand:- start:453 stop:683 length:231 start_codon:yes stop_codon:yes gene_type:complete